MSLMNPLHEHNFNKVGVSHTIKDGADSFGQVVPDKIFGLAKVQFQILDIGLMYLMVASWLS